MNNKLKTYLGALSKIFKRAPIIEDLDNKILLAEQLAGATEWKDEHHLRLCSQSEIKKRFLDYSSAVNMRDIGGYTNESHQQIKWHKIYRGIELCHLNQEDREKFSKLGITHIFDLRNPERTKIKPDFVPPGAIYQNIPVLKDLGPGLVDESYPNIVDQFMRNIYNELVRKRGNEFAQVLEVLAYQPDAVIYIHCTNGKDRTGIMIALIELLCGLPFETVISDYSLSNYEVDKAFKLFDAEFLNLLGKNKEKLLYGTIGVDPDWLNNEIHYLYQEYSNIDDYLLRNSVMRKIDLEKVRSNVLEKMKK